MPSFVLAGPRDRLFAWGMRAALSESMTIPVAERASSFLQAADPALPPVLVGALPFSQNRPAHLFQPERIARGSEGGPATMLDAAPNTVACVMECHAVPTPDAYACAVRAALDRMDGQQGERLHKVVLARSLQLRCLHEIDPAAVMCRLARDPSATVFSVSLPDGGTVPRRLVGGTPELLVSKHGHEVLSHPLAGSARRRLLDPGEDQAAGEALLRSDKDRREHAAVAEWVADRLSPWCRELEVPRSPSLVRTATLWHLGTQVRGVLRDPDTPSLTLASVLHPTPAVCGSPEQAATSLLHELEGFDRGFFTGAVGWTDAAGDGAWYLAIRCAELAGATAQLYAGAGIVRGSLAESEVAETEAKLGVMMSALTGDATLPTPA